MKSLIFAALVIVAGTAISWAVTVGIIKLLTLCFGLRFSIPVATGIWILVKVAKAMFDGKGDG